jgi:CRP-like cAMP-binding protein
MPVLDFLSAPQYARNDLLAALPQHEFDRLRPHLSQIELAAGGELQQPGRQIDFVYFPGGGLCSVFREMQEGASMEVSWVRADGIVGIEALPPVTFAATQAIVQINDRRRALRLSADIFRRELEQLGVFRSVIHGYLARVVRDSVVNVSCVATHSVTQRCCRWLLEAFEIRSELYLTHEQLAAALGVRRPTVSLIIASLRSDAVIATDHHALRLLNGDGLQAHACSCRYEPRRRIVRAEL